MKYITTKLKRYKVVIWSLTIISLPVRFPLFIVYKIGKVSEKLLEAIDSLLYKILERIVKVFKFDDAARKQYKVNKDKFKLD